MLYLCYVLQYPIVPFFFFLFLGRLPGLELIRANEASEPNDLCCLLGNKESYVSLMNGKTSVLIMLFCMYLQDVFMCSNFNIYIFVCLFVFMV